MNENIIKSLIEEFGTPLYVFDDREFVNNYRALCEAFRNIYPNYIPAYSYKTNYTPHICKLVKDLGGFAEVVSDMEMEVALRIGYQHKDIIYNGPAKGILLEKHLLNGGIVNIDNLSELDRIIEIAQNHSSNLFKVGLRINTDIGANFLSRFGFDVEGGELDKVMALIGGIENIKVVGLHLHISRARYIEAWKNRIDNIIAVADKYIEGIPEYIDLGSGMFADMEDYLKSQFSIAVPTYKEYAEVIATKMATHYSKSVKPPMLITEPGTTLVSRYLSLLTSVKAVKNIKGHHFAILDCDFHNAGEVSQMMKLPYTHFKFGSGQEVNCPVDLTGYTCLEQDCLIKDFPNSVCVGDILQFRNIGGYSIVYKPPFINPCCPMIAVGNDDTISVIKRGETFDDVFATYKF